MTYRGGKWEGVPAWLAGNSMWPGAKTGRIVKRRLSKARRRYARELIISETDEGYIPHVRGLDDAESEANWKCT